MDLNGILIFSEGNIFEVLEGDEVIVNSLFSTYDNHEVFSKPIKIFSKAFEFELNRKNEFLLLNTKHQSIGINEILPHLHISNFSSLQGIKEILKAIVSNNKKENIPSFLIG